LAGDERLRKTGEKACDCRDFFQAVKKEPVVGKMTGSGGKRGSDPSLAFGVTGTNAPLKWSAVRL
jgi:hypothetical protein